MTTNNCPLMVQYPDEFYRQTGPLFIQSSYGPAGYEQRLAACQYFPSTNGAPPSQLAAPVPPGNSVEKKKKHRKKKKKHRDSSDEDTSDEEDGTSSIAVYSKQNGRRVVVVPQDASVVVRPQRNPQPYLGPERVPFRSDVMEGQWVDPRDGFAQTYYTEEYLNPLNSHYESRIVPGYGGLVQPEIQMDPFIDEGPYERRLPVGGYGVEPGISKPQPGPWQFIERPSVVEQQLIMGGGQPYGAPIAESNFILRPSDVYGQPSF
jgi:hypothetical protein